MTSAVFATLAGVGVEVLDIEQIVLRAPAVLGVLVTAPRDWKALRDARGARSPPSLGMSVDVDRGTGDNRPPPRGPQPRHGARHAAARPRAVAAIAGRIADTGANIDRIERMARYPVTAIELHVSGADPDALRAVLAAEAARAGASTSPSSRPTCCAAACGWS